MKHVGFQAAGQTVSQLGSQVIWNARIIKPKMAAKTIEKNNQSAMQKWQEKGDNNCDNSDN